MHILKNYPCSGLVKYSAKIKCVGQYSIYILNFLTLSLQKGLLDIDIPGILIA